MEIKKSAAANLEDKKIFFREIGLIIALAFVLFAFEWKTYESNANTMRNQDAVIVEEEMIPITREAEPPPPDMPKEPTVSDFLDLVDDDIKIEHELIINTEDNKNLGIEIREFVHSTGNIAEEIMEEEIRFEIVEEKPKFQGGSEQDFSKWVGERIIYPEVAKENGIYGRVTLSFVVGTDGRVSDVTVLRGVDPALDKEAVRVVQSSPRWTPGRQRDKAVKVRYNFPVIFQLK
ncbi:MAG: energy transducer TonB [Prevotellaceae bacterium]|jgi:protein TonB|nr:energy transducer TonB [Prevotellaceae bacterium]